MTVLKEHHDLSKCVCVYKNSWVQNCFLFHQLSSINEHVFKSHTLGHVNI